MSTVRYWAGAKAAAGVAEDTVHGATVADAVREVLQLHPGLQDVVPHCALLVDGKRSDADAALPAGAVLEILPPFAGG